MSTLPLTHRRYIKPQSVRGGRTTELRFFLRKHVESDMQIVAMSMKIITQLPSSTVKEIDKYHPIL